MLETTFLYKYIDKHYLPVYIAIYQGSTPFQTFRNKAPTLEIMLTETPHRPSVILVRILT